MNWTNWLLGVLGIFLVVALIFCFVAGFYTYGYESKCREQGGIPLKGVCIKADTIKVTY